MNSSQLRPIDKRFDRSGWFTLQRSSVLPWRRYAGRRTGGRNEADLTTRIDRRPPSGIQLWLLGSVTLWALYAFVFVQTAAQSPVEAMVAALANVLPLSLLAAGTREVLKGYVMPLGVGAQAASHVGLGIGFATTWYATVIVTLAFFKGLAGGGFDVRGFSGPAFTWQVFQGLIIYALVAAVCYAIRGGREASSVEFVTSPPSLDRYLTRDGDEMRPVEVRRIVTIIGAQDYSEVTTLDGRHLVRMGLGEFEQRLDSNRFIRVHRSAIINFDHLDRLEPAGGGRMLAHMASGDSVDVSRSGAQALKSFVV